MQNAICFSTKFGWITATEQKNKVTSIRFKKSSKQGKTSFLLNKLKISYNQEAPIFSALKINGKKMYELAREGIEVKPKVRNVKLFDFEIIDFEKPTFSIKILCSKGFYVRSLARDIGTNLGTHAHLTSLVRTKSSGFDIDDSYSLEQINHNIISGDIKKLITPIDKLLTEIKSIYGKGYVVI